MLVNAEDIDIIGSTKRIVTAALSASEQESADRGLPKYEVNTKYWLSTIRDIRHIGSSITVNNDGFEDVKEYVSFSSRDQTKSYYWQQVLLWCL